MRRSRRLLLLVPLVAPLWAMFENPDPEHVSLSLARDAAIYGPPALVVLAAGALAALVAQGRAGARDAVRFALGDEERSGSAALAWHAFARGATAAGLVLAGFATLASLSAFDPASWPEAGPSPAELAVRVRWLILPPLYGFLCGRLLGGGLAAGAARRAGRPAPEWNDAALLTALVFPAVLLIVITTPIGVGS